MKILIGCEFSGIVRNAFTERGHDTISCDLLPSEKPGKHYQGDLRDILYSEHFDLGIFHPPCNNLAVSGARWFNEKIKSGEQKKSIDFFMLCANAPINKICIENPVGIMSNIWRKPDQIINPWQFGHTENKKTCLWLKNLPKLYETDNVKEIMKIFYSKKEQNKIYYMSPSKTRNLDRSRTFSGIAAAMANQWG